MEKSARRRIVRPRRAAPRAAGTGRIAPRIACANRNNLLLLVDQFEEIFRFHKHGDANEATAFINLLLESARQHDLPIYVVITMRSDFLGDCSIFAGLPEAINDGQYLIPRLSREQCRAAVAGPAASFGATVQPELVNHVLNDIGSNPDQLPLMQHALMRVWNRTAGGNGKPHEDDEVTLTLTEYQAVGGLKNALSNHADELYERLAPEDRRSAELLFRCLSKRGDDGRDIRRPVPLAVVAEVAQVPAETIMRIVEVFREPGCSFLMPPAGVPLQPDTVLDISHESLLRQWHRMAQWVQAEAESAAMFRRLEDTALLWKAGQAALWRTPDLENALCWRKREKPNAAWAQRYGGRFAESMGFLDASVEAHDHQLREEGTSGTRTRIAAKRGAGGKAGADDAEAHRREQAHANGQLKRRAIAALATGVVAAVLAVFAFVLFAQARTEKQRADDARQEAERDRQRAEVAKQLADELAGKEADARKKSQLAELKAIQTSDDAFRSLGEAKVAQLQSLRVSDQPGRQARAFQLLRQAVKLRDTALDLAGRQDPAQREVTEQFWRQKTPQLRSEAVHWLSATSLQPVHQKITLLATSDDRTSHAISADLKLASSDFQSGKRKLEMRDMVTGNVISSLDLTDNRSIVAMGFSGDGATVVASRPQIYTAAGQPVRVDYYSPTDLKITKSLDLPSDNLPQFWGNDPFWFNGPATRLVYAGFAGTAGTVVWDLAAGKQLFADKQVRAVAMTDADDHLIALDNKSAVRIIDLKHGKIVREIAVPGGVLINGSALASGWEMVGTAARQPLPR